MSEPGGIDFVPTGPLLPVEGMSGPTVEVDLRAIYRTRSESRIANDEED